MNELALFAGAGGGILGGSLLGWRTVCAVEWEPYPASVLAARQNDGLLPAFPIWDDVRTFDGNPWRGVVDVVSGGFPCQDISVAGKGAGISGERSGMWTHMARIIGEVRPRFAFVENSPALLTRGLGVVLGDLAALGYDCKWTVLGAADVGAPHKRDRFWLVAHAASKGFPQRRCTRQSASRAQTCSGLESESERCGSVANSNGHRDERRGERGVCEDGSGWNPAPKRGIEVAEIKGLGETPSDFKQLCKPASYGGADWWTVEPDICRVANGVAARVDRIKAIGNGQVPLVAAAAWRMLTKATEAS